VRSGRNVFQAAGTVASTKVEDRGSASLQTVETHDQVWFIPCASVVIENYSGDLCLLKHDLRDPDLQHRRGFTLGWHRLATLSRILSAGLVVGVGKQGVMKPTELPVFPFSTPKGHLPFERIGNTWGCKGKKSRCSCDFELTDGSNGQAGQACQACQGSVRIVGVQLLRRAIRPLGESLSRRLDHRSYCNDNDKNILK
jgi:hypothetical protein